MSELFNGHDWRITLDEAKNLNGKTKSVARAHRVDSVHLLAFPSEKEILLLREYRPYYAEWIWMLPSGRVDKETDIFTAAQRELQEETGYRAEELKHYCTTNHSEFLVMSNHIFIAQNLKPDPLPQDEHEVIEVHRLTLSDALEKVLASPKVHTPSAYGLLRYMREFGG